MSMPHSNIGFTIGVGARAKLRAESSAGRPLSRITPIGSGVMLRASRRSRVEQMSGAARPCRAYAAVVLWGLDAG